MSTAAGRANGERAVALARECRADVVVMDIRMPGTDGIAATARIAADDNLSGVRVLILTTFESDQNVLAALRAGAAGDALLSPGATRALISRVLTQPDAAAA